jgi:hypothetical protein
MPKQIEEIFTPERLRKSWEKLKSKRPDETQKKTNENAQMSSFNALYISLQEHFYGENLAVLNLLMDSLQPVWESLFADDAGNNNPAVDAETMIPAAHELLNQIEDLSFAFKIGNSAKHP